MNTDQQIIQQRKTENLHIVFWLIKDISWCLIFKWLGLLMIVPTMTIAIIITIRNKKIISELYHNLAVVLWIAANSYWMISEFFHFDALPLFGFTYKHLAAIPFGLGIIILGYYYLFVQNKKLQTS